MHCCKLMHIWCIFAWCIFVYVVETEILFKKTLLRKLICSSTICEGCITQVWMKYRTAGISSVCVLKWITEWSVMSDGDACTDEGPARKILCKVLVCCLLPFSTEDSACLPFQYVKRNDDGMKTIYFFPPSWFLPIFAELFFSNGLIWISFSRRLELAFLHDARLFIKGKELNYVVRT